MYVAHLTLRRLPVLRRPSRSPLEPGVTAFIGPNGQGKTNLVEAIGYLATLSSHRVAADAPLVRAGAERAVVRARSCRDDRAPLLEVEITPGKANRARVNRSPLPRARELLGMLRTVLFAPEDLALVKGDPAERRRFLDDLLVLRTPRLAGVRADYDRVLKQRNALLKSAGAARRGAGAQDDLSHARGLGLPPGAAPAPSCWPRGSTWSTSCARWSTRPTRRSPAGPASDDAEPSAASPAWTIGGLRRPRRSSPSALLARARACGAATSSTAASRWSVRTATSCCSLGR